MKLANGEELVDSEPVKKMLKLQDRAFRDLHKQGLPHYRINSRVYRYSLSEIEEWLKTKRA